MPPIALLAGGAAVLIGGLSGVDPRLGVLAAIAVTFVAIVLADLLVGLVVMVVFALLEVLSVFGGVSLAKLAGVLIVVAWLAALTAGGGRARNFFAERAGLTYLLLAFVGWNAISLAWAESSGDATSSVMRYALNVALVPIVYTAVRDRRDATRIFATIVVGASIAAIWGIVTAPDPVAGDYARAEGAVGDPNELAAALLVGLALAVAFAVSRSSGPLVRLLCVGASVLCFAGILATLSRGGLLGLLTITVMTIVVGGRWRGRVIAVSGAVLVAVVCYFAVVASPAATDRVLTTGGGTGRLDLWTVGSRMVTDRPLAGVGTGQFANASVHYLLEPGSLERGDLILIEPKVAHNTYLEVLAEVGLVGTVLFAAILAFCFGCGCLAVQGFRRDGDERMEMLARGFVVGLSGYLVAILFISENYSKLMWILLALGPVLLALARAQRTG